MIAYSGSGLEKVAGLMITLNFARKVRSYAEGILYFSYPKRPGQMASISFK